MRKLIMWNLMTLDGYFEGKKAWDLGFHELVWGKELEEFSIVQLESADMLVFGKNTYKGMAEYWTNAEDNEAEVAEYMNRIPKLVCSTTLKTADWNNSTIVRDAVSELAKIKHEGSGDMYVFGSGILSESLLKAKLFDEIRLCIVPVILGNGRRLFNEEMQKQNLNLIHSNKLSNGGIILKYNVFND